MSQFKLQLVRMDCNHVVLTEHPDRIHPRDLSVWLVDKYGAAHVKISLRRNIYVIYIDREVIDNGEISSFTKTNMAEPQGEPTEGEIPEWKRNLLDIKEAEEVLKKSRIPKS